MEEYKRIQNVVKRMVREARKMVNAEWNLNVAENFEEDKKNTWEGK